MGRAQQPRKSNRLDKELLSKGISGWRVVWLISRILELFTDDVTGRMVELLRGCGPTAGRPRTHQRG